MKRDEIFQFSHTDPSFYELQNSDYYRDVARPDGKMGKIP